MNEKAAQTVVEISLEKSLRWMHSVQAMTDGLNFESSPRSRLSITLHHLAIEHHQAIHTLVDNGVFGSAFALLRPQLEAYVRGMWYGACAKDEDIASFFKDIDPPPFKTLATQLVEAEVLDEALLRIHSHSWKQLCGLTHGGMNQVIGRNTRDQIISRYEPEQVANLVDSAAVFALSACAGIARVLEDHAFATKAAEEYNAAYGTRIGKGTET